MKLENLQRAQDKYRDSATLAVDTMTDIMKNSKSDKARLDAAKYILDVVCIAPIHEAGLWLVGATTAEELESQVHCEAMRARFQMLQR